MDRESNWKNDKHKLNKFFDNHSTLLTMIGLLLVNVFIWIIFLIFWTFKFNVFILIGIDLFLVLAYGVYSLIVIKIGDINKCFKCGFCTKCHTKELWQIHELTKFRLPLLKFSNDNLNNNKKINQENTNLNKFKSSNYNIFQIGTAGRINTENLKVENEKLKKQVSDIIEYIFHRTDSCNESLNVLEPVDHHELERCREIEKRIRMCFKCFQRYQEKEKKGLLEDIIRKLKL